MIRRLSDVAGDDGARKEFVGRLVAACGWEDAEEIWEEAVSKALDVPEVGNDLALAEDAAMAMIAPVLIVLGF